MEPDEEVFLRPLLPLPKLALPDAPPAPDDAIFGKPLPGWLKEIRPDQWDATCAIVEEFQRGARVVIFDAPTGSGKTLIGELTRRLLRQRALYTCSTLSLQDQMLADFPYCAVVKGRSNYPTLDLPDRFRDRLSPISCADCAFDRERGCPWCAKAAECPYRMAKNAAIPADVAVVNTAFFLTEANGPGAFAGRPLLILDEADLLESALMSHVEVTITPKWQRKLGLNPPPRKTVESTWAPWVNEEALPAVLAALPLQRYEPSDIASIRERNFLKRLANKLSRLSKELPEGGWVYDEYAKGNITFRPVCVHQVAPELIWRHASRFLLASATVIDPVSMAASVGIPEGSYAVVRMGSTFPASNRPVYVAPMAENSRKNRDVAWPKMAAASARILARHPDDRILVHSVSYDFSAYLFDQLQQMGFGLRLVTYSSAGDRQSALDRYREVPGAVIVAPSLDRGIDLPGDLCRVQVICKVPFPNLGDKQIAARLYSPGGRLWYSTQTVRSLVQMTGRGMRSASDSCTTYLLDGSFVSNVWRSSRNLLPRWWTSSLQFSGDVVHELLSASKEHA